MPDPLQGYTVFGLKDVWSPRDNIDIELDGRNLLDRWYELSDGYPMPGRSWFANLVFRF